MCNGNGKPCSSKLTPYCKRHGPTKADGPGFIYIYRISGDITDYYKIGRTAKSVQKRIEQWGKNTILVESYYVKFQKMAERYIHGLLDEYRVYRYTLENGAYYSVWKRTNKPVEGEIVLKEKLQGSKKHIEWFKGSWDDVMKETVQWVVNEVDSLRVREADRKEKDSITDETTET